MPDAIRLLEILGKHPVFGQRLRRWTHHEAWMCIGYIIPDEDGETAMSKSAQLHFPRVQLDELTAALIDA